MLDVVLLAAGAAAMLVAALYAHLEQWSITPPLVGLLIGILVGPEVLGLVTIPPGDHVHVLQLAARLVLAVALMAIGLRYPFGHLRPHVRELALLLLVVLPLMAAVVGVGGAWALGLPLGTAFVLGAALSPTDPVLASGIVTGEPAERDVPERGREVLSFESALNDGLALPFVLLALAWTLDESMVGALGRSAWQVGAAVVVGAVAGVMAGRVLRWAHDHREIGTTIESLYTLVLAALLLGLSGVIGINGLLAVFVAGLAHNRVISGADREVEVTLDESLGQFFVIPVFVLLGAMLPWRQWVELGWGGAAFVVVALLLRRLPAVLLLRRAARTDLAHATWLGWFGPIGVAALFYLGHVEAAGVTDPRIWAAGTLVIAASTLVHGLTAGPARLAYRRRSTRGPDADITGTDTRRARGPS